MQITNQKVLVPAKATEEKKAAVTREDLLRPLPKFGIRAALLSLLGIVVLLWSLVGTNVRPSELARGIPNIINFLVRLMPPQFDPQPVADLPFELSLPFTIQGTSMEELAAEMKPEDIANDMPDWYKQASAEAAGETAPASDTATTASSSPAETTSTQTTEVGTGERVAQVVKPPWFQWKPSTVNKVFLPAIVPAVIQTLQMAIIGSLLSIFFAIPFGLLAARNITPSPAVYQVVRFLMNIIRSVPEIIIALVFVAAVGLGPFGGVMALGIAAIGSVARSYAESIEQIDPQQVQAIRATGARGMQIFSFGVIPQILPLVTSYSLSLFEHNLRAASILGLVGAGGSGFLLSKYLALFEYQKLMGAVIILVLTVTVIDRLSARLRKAII